MKADNERRPACFGAKRIGGNLKLVTEVLWTAGIVKDTFASDARTCCEIIAAWKLWVNAEEGRIRGRRRSLEFSQAVKGTKRVFDEDCTECDLVLAKEARLSWIAKMVVPMPVLLKADRESIKSRARILMGDKWWTEWRGEKELLVPDQNGCLELPAGLGGTLSVPKLGEEGLRIVRESEEGSDNLHRRVKSSFPDDLDEYELRVRTKCSSLLYEDIVESQESNVLRLGCAKSKGKFRVVTMQSARTKRMLKPVHEAAYDWISSFGWCVRGEVGEAELMPIIADRRGDEDFISGDFEAATDNLNPDAVLAIVEVLAEGLPGDLGRELLASFTDIRLNTGEMIRRGSMMGNCVSFVVLCLLNKVCHEITFDHSDREFVVRKVRINGDDIVFCGNDAAFRRWRKVTGIVGFVVNETKTGRSRTQLELNSKILLEKSIQCRDVKTRGGHHYCKSRVHRFFDGTRTNWKFVRSLKFGFLRTNTTPTEQLSSIFSLCDSVSFSVATFVLRHYRIKDIIQNRDIPVSVVPRRWWSFLVKRWWFRAAVVKCPVDVEHRGDERVLPMVMGPLLADEWAKEEVEEAVRDLEKAETEKLVHNWRGVMCIPNRRKLVSWSSQRSLPTVGKDRILVRKPYTLRRLWMKPVLDFLRRVTPECLREDDDTRADARLYRRNPDLGLEGVNFRQCGLTLTREWAYKSQMYPPPDWRGGGVSLLGGPAMYWTELDEIRRSWPLEAFQGRCQIDDIHTSPQHCV